MAVVLLTGAAGFIGSHVSERLLARGDQVIGVDSFDPFYPRAVKERNLGPARGHDSFTFVEADLCDAAAVRVIYERHHPTHVIHLAAKAGVRPSVERPNSYVDANVQATLNLLNGAPQGSLAHFVFASSSSVYGDTTQVPFREDARTDTPESPYAATKKAGEVLCFTYHQLAKMPITCLRFFTVYGPRQRPDLAIHKFIRLIETGQPIQLFGDGTTSRDYTYVDDTVDGVVAALDRPQDYAIYNLGSHHPVSLIDMVRTIERVTGKTAQIEWKPVQPGDVTTTYADVTRAGADLGYAPKVPFEEGIRRMVAWWRENNDV
jgi:UDP-glucuronate 4-epimerase